MNLYSIETEIRFIKTQFKNNVFRTYMISFLEVFKAGNVSGIFVVQIFKNFFCLNTNRG